ncbi:iron-containing alcohol dehydrogenase [Tropicimonas sp. IMCC6043]|uniref:iron-containing alcohol dehydrogenase n=1 Tax=Tropicimonas sp. IMCC6043 TaxID=2510645 RepID=UPI00352E344B
MPEFVFATATEIRFGRGAARRAIGDLAGMGQRILLVTGADASRSEWLRVGLEAAGRSVLPFSASGEPDVALIETGVEQAREGGTEAVVAIGGGAAIDTGKAIAALAPATRPMLDHLEVVGRGLPLEVPALPFAALPTTAGTGTEVTRNAVISVPEARRKVSLRDRAMLPALAVIDPGLTDGCPRAVTLAAGLDAITQVIEPYLCTRANPLTDALCRAAIPAGLGALSRLMEREDSAGRDTMAWVSLCGGLALSNAGLGAIHGLAGPLGGMSGAAHGALCGVLLPHGLAANAAGMTEPASLARIAEIRGWISEALGGAPESAFERLAAWSRAAGLAGLDAQGVSAADRAAASKAAASSSSMKANPVALSEAELAAVIEAAR